MLPQGKNLFPLLETPPPFCYPPHIRNKREISVHSKSLFRSLLVGSAICYFSANVVSPALAQDKKRTIGLFCPRDDKDTFYSVLRDAMNASTTSLGMELKVFYAEDDRNKMKTQVEEATT